eukprot:c35346_g1_i1 orf=247-447(+)
MRILGLSRAKRKEETWTRRAKGSQRSRHGFRPVSHLAPLEFESAQDQGPCNCVGPYMVEFQVSFQL